MRNSRAIGRIAALVGAVAATAIVAVVLLRGSGTDFEVRANFQSAAQLVKGDLVQVAGRKVGNISDIRLTDDGQAQVEMHITDPDYAPLREGTTATIRQASLSGVANRYIDLHLPSGERSAMGENAVISSADTTTAVDLDQLFNTFNPKSRQALSGFIRGQAKMNGGSEADANAGFMYLNPTLGASSRLFQELNYDTPLLRRFIDANAGLVTTLAARRNDLTGVVSNLADTTRAISDRSANLNSALLQLPTFMRRSNTTFVNLRATLDDLQPLVDDSKPVAKKLRPFLAQLRPLARDARPTLRDLTKTTRAPGKDNDLIDLVNSAPDVRKAALDGVTVDGKARDSSFVATADALKTSAPELGYVRPYAVDLTGWFDDFGHSGIVDALGGASRVEPHVNAFATTQSATGSLLTMTPLLTPEAQQQNLKGVASLGQRNRCPGAMERGSVYKPTPDYNCDASQVPLGP